MPSTLISIRRPRLPAERSAIIEAVHAAMVAAIKIPERDRTLRLQTFEAADFNLGADASENYTLVEISLFSGRSNEAKRALYKEIVARLGELGIAPTDVKVILHEVPRENWGLRGGQSGADIALGFKVDV
jgi:phenylpyruvate tautomerase PptA (4-oxalocrotonate tautomerase family)